MNRTEILPRVDGSEIPTSYALGRCDSHWVGVWPNNREVKDCGLAFFWKRTPGDDNVSVTCPSCGKGLEITTRRLRAGFLPLSPADVTAIHVANGYAALRPAVQAQKAVEPGDWWHISDAQRNALVALYGALQGQPVEVSCLSPIVATPVAPVAVASAPALAPAPVKSPKLDAALAALSAFDAKPRCACCWAYNAAIKKSPYCGFCREWGKTEVDQISQGERDQYTYKRGELVARVEKAGGVAPEAPVAGYAAHVAERTARKAAERERRVAELRAQGLRVRP